MAIVGVVGGSVGNDPFDLRTWSGSSYFLFDALARRNELARAFGVTLPPVLRLALQAKNFSPERRLWRRKFYLDIQYRKAMTKRASAGLQPSDFESSFLQVGTWFNMPSVLRGRAPCYSYSDSNLVQSLRSSDFAHRPPESKIRAAMEYDREIYHSVDKVFCFSEYLRQSFISDFGVPADRVVNIGGGINLERFPEATPDKNYDSKEVLFIGIDFVRKGGPQLLTAFAAVAGVIPNAVLHIVGPPQVTIPAALRDRVVQHGFLNKRSPEESARLTALFNRCSLFVMPSLFEPFGIAPLEAMLYQLPCIVTNDWALKEIVRPGINGELVERASADDLAEKLVRLLRSPDSLRRMGMRGRELALELYTWDSVAGRLLAALGEPAPQLSSA
jgi:glycosyltransferase involved in cell wall biosynthesis